MGMDMSSDTNLSVALRKLQNDSEGETLHSKIE